MWIFYAFFFFWLHFNKIGLVLISFFHSCDTIDFAPVCPTPETTPSTFIAAKGQYKSSKHIKTSQTGCNQRYGPQSIIPCIKGNTYNIILAEKAIEEREATYGECTDKPGNSCNGHQWTKSSHHTHILRFLMRCMMQGIQYTACAKEEQSLKESMCEKVEHTKARTICSSRCNAHSYEHVAELTIAPQKIKIIATVSTVLSMCMTAVGNWLKLNVPVLTNKIMMPMIKPTSPTRFAIKASIDALAGERRSSAGLDRLLNQNTISRYELRPTSSP